MPNFETERFFLRPRTMEDTSACFEMDSDPEVIRFIPGPWDDPAAHRAFIETRTLGPWPDGMGYWVIEARDQPGSFLGWILLLPTGGPGSDVEIGWRLTRRFWGQGIATEAARPVLDHALNGLGLDRVVAEIAAANAGSISVAEKLGMTLERSDETAAVVRYSISAA
jgi:RimJ/RimL family protein N-acetyltransferase